MDFVEWWKKSSAEASAAHYAQRFDEREIEGLQRGVLTDSARRKLEMRLAGLKKRNRFLLVGCGVPLGAFAVAAAVLLGFVFFRAVLRSTGNLIAWFFAAFFIFVVGAIAIFFAKILYEWLSRKSALQIDLKSHHVAVDRGKVAIKITSGENSFNIAYAMRGVEYALLDDALGWEIHTHFFGGPNVTGQASRETKEDYVFYSLPKSRLLLHFELV